MFQINVWDLLSSYTGDSKELEFEGEVMSGYYEDIVFTKPLSFRIKLIALDDGIEAIFETIDTEVEHEGLSREVHIENVARTFKEWFDPLAPDDIKFIESKNKTIDFKDVLREEILISLY